MRLSPWPLAAAILSLGVPAAADPFIGFTDNTFNLPGSGAALSDTASNWAVGWTQTVATTDVTVRALIDVVSNGNGNGNWWITTKLGPTATPADVVASGIYTAPNLADTSNFNTIARTELASGLSFAPGSYFLVLDGPPGQFFNNAAWIAAFGPADTVEVAAGFSLGSYYVVASSYGSPVDFGPAATFGAPTGDGSPVFELDGKITGVPEPAAWVLMIGGFSLAGGALRRRRAAAA